MANNQFVEVIPNSELVRREQEAAKAEEDAIRAETEATKPQLDSLAQYVTDRWHRARDAKRDIKDKLLANLHAFRSEYDPVKLQAIRDMGSAETFVPLTNIKCRAGEAWVKEILLQPNEVPWDVAPTPVPELPDEDKQMIMAQVQEMYMRGMANLQMMQQQTGQIIPPEVLKQQVKAMAMQLKAMAEKQVEDLAKMRAEKVKKIIEDKFVQGGMPEALSQALHDLFIFKSAFIKGPIFRLKKRIVMGQTGPQVEEQIIEQYERRSPFDIYPAPNSGGINDDYLFDKVSMTPQQLSELIGVDGFNEEAIRSVLDKYHGGSLREWTEINRERDKLENKGNNLTDAEIIDVLEFWGGVKGSLLTSWGLTEGVEDPDKFYDVCVWMIDGTIIKAMLSYDPLGQKPFSKASFIEIPGSFWGMGVPDVLEPLQQSVNAVARAIVNNAALASGPMIERNIDRLPKFDKIKISPWKVFDSTESAMASNAPAFRFYQPSMVSDKLMQVMNEFMKTADETSGIPAYAHGDVTVGGAGRTATGLSMLTNNANRGIKEVIKNIDMGFIEDLVRRQFNICLTQGEFGTDVPDLNIVAKGSVSLSEKELRTARMTELLQATVNPMDSQILGYEGRKYLLEAVAKSHGIDTSKLFPSGFMGQPNIMQPQLGAPEEGQPGQVQPGAEQQAGGAPKEKPANMNAAGQTHGGQEVRQFQGENG